MVSWKKKKKKKARDSLSHQSISLIRHSFYSFWFSWTYRQNRRANSRERWLARRWERRRQQSQREKVDWGIFLIHFDFWFKVVVFFPFNLECFAFLFFLYVFSIYRFVVFGRKENWVIKHNRIVCHDALSFDRAFNSVHLFTPKKYLFSILFVVAMIIFPIWKEES